MTDSVPRLFLILPAKSAVLAAIGNRLPNPAIASVLLTGAPECSAKELRATTQALQSAEIAVLCEAAGDAERAGADGVHINLAGAEDTGPLKQAVRTMKPAGIVGTAGLKSRHAAMEAGEQDIDYVMFGEPGADGGPPPLDSVLERSRWWSEIFTIPSVVFAPTVADIPAIAATGCDFIAILLDPDRSAHDVAGELETALRTLQELQETAQ